MAAVIRAVRKVVVAFYARVSTEEQRDRQTIDAQLDYARKRAEIEGWELRVFIDDGVSGTIPFRERPAGRELLDALKSGEIDMVTSYRVDRMGRKLRVVLEAVEALGVPYRSLTEPFDTGTPLGHAMLGILGVFAELERDTFIERSRAGTERVAKQPGRWLGGIVPYGYVKRTDMTVTIDERPMPGVELVPGMAASPADVVRQVFRWCGVEGWSTNHIAKELNMRGIPTSYVLAGREVLSGEILGTRALREGKRKRNTSGTWYDSRILLMLHNEMYVGRHRYGKHSPQKRDLIERTMPAIVSPRLFEQVQERLYANSEFLRNQPKRDYLLRKLIDCECGHKLIGCAWRGKGGALYTVYKCHAHSSVTRAVRVNGVEAEEAMWRDVEEFLSDPNAVVRSIARRIADAGAEEGRIERELLNMTRELRELGEQEDRLLDASLRELFTRNVLEAKAKTLAAQKKAVERRMETLRRQRAHAATAAEESLAVKSLLGDLKTRVKTAGAQERAEVLRRLVKSARASWEGDSTRLEVTYAFDPHRPVVPIPTTDIDSEDRYYEVRTIEKVHILAAMGRWPTRAVTAGSSRSE